MPPKGADYPMHNRRKHIAAIVLGCAILGLAGCGAEPSGGGGSQTMSYKDMKSMVIDILKTEDAQKALQESASATASGGGMMALSVQDQEQVRLAVKDVLVAPGYETVIEKLMTDPKFAGEFAKAVNKQNKQIHKDLLKDPTYQKDLATVFKGPEFEKTILDIMKGTEYRKQVSSIMKETIESPIVKLELYELLQKAVHEELKPKEEKKSEGGSEDGGGEGDSGGSGDGSGEEGGG